MVHIGILMVVWEGLDLLKEQEQLVEDLVG